jgi:hypothetical protein
MWCLALIEDEPKTPDTLIEKQRPHSRMGSGSPLEGRSVLAITEASRGNGDIAADIACYCIIC